MRIGLLLLVLQSVLLCASVQAQTGLPKAYKVDSSTSFLACGEKNNGSPGRAGDDSSDGEAQIDSAAALTATGINQARFFPSLARQILHGGKVDNIRAPPFLP